MVDPAVQKVGLETIVVILERLVWEAREIDQPVLAFMIYQAKLEAENQVRMLADNQIPQV